MAVVRSGWPFFVMSLAFLLLASLMWRHWPLGLDPCGSASGSLARLPGVPVDDDLCGGNRTTVGLIVPVGLAVMSLLVGALGLVPVRRTDP